MALLVRHATHDLADRVLVGRSPVSLSRTGHRQALRLAESLAREPIACVQSSPQRRALQTAQRIATALELPVDVAPTFDEIDTGRWTGRSFDALAPEPDWQAWNARRGTACVPDGESMSELQARVVSHLVRLAADYSGQQVVIVSHAEPIRAAIMQARRMALDDFARVRVDIASVTRLLVRPHRMEIVGENESVQCREAA